MADQSRKTGSRRRVANGSTPLGDLDPSTLDEQDRIDLELMQHVAANQESAVAELYDRFGSLVYRMAIQSMPTRGEAEDAVQEVFVRLWRTAERYDPRRAALVTWVMLITRRHLVDKLRRKRARIKAIGLDDYQPSSDNGDGPHRNAARAAADCCEAGVFGWADPPPDRRGAGHPPWNGEIRAQPSAGETP